MLHFDGFMRSCVKYQMVDSKQANKGKALRCVEFEAGRANPACPSATNKSFKLVGGGRSQNYLRANRLCKESTVAKRPAPEKKTPAKKTTKPSRKK